LVASVHPGQPAPMRRTNTSHHSCEAPHTRKTDSPAAPHSRVANEASSGHGPAHSLLSPIAFNQAPLAFRLTASGRLRRPSSPGQSWWACATHRSAARWPAPSVRPRPRRSTRGSQGGGQGGHWTRRPVAPSTSEPTTADLGAADIAMADFCTSRRLPSPQPCRGQHPSGQGRKSPSGGPWRLPARLGALAQVGPARGERLSRRR
jgi:hypothetical protein